MGELRNIEEVFSGQNEKKLADKLEQELQTCKEAVDRIEACCRRGIMADEAARNEKLQTAFNAWGEIKKLCDIEGIKLEDDKCDYAYRTIFASVGIPIAKVPVRYYPSVERFSSSFCCFREVKNIESFFYDSDFEGKTYNFKILSPIGEESILIDYIFEIEKEAFEMERDSNWEGWKCFSGYGKPEGYKWAEGLIYVREYEGKVHSVVYQKIYLNFMDPIWKKRADLPVEGYQWIGIYEELPENLEIPEGEFYSDETTNPPRGRHYKEQGIFAYDDADEIVILGIKNQEAEIVEIPGEINGKPVTALDERCFANCRENLRKVILPETLKEIGDYAFEYCEKLEKPEMPASVTKIGKDIFRFVP